MPESLLLEKVEDVILDGLVKKRNAVSYCITIKSEGVLSSTELSYFASQVKALIRINNKEKMSILIRSDYKNVADMPVVSILEQLIYLLVKTERFNIKLQFRYDRLNSLNKYFENSILGEFNFKVIDSKVYSEYILSNINLISHDHFRKNVFLSDETEITIRKMCADMFTFFTNLLIGEEVVSEVVEMISELSINMHEHGKSDFTVEVHVNQTINKSKEEVPGKLVSITIYNLSERKLYSGLGDIVRENILTDEQKHLYTAYDYHINNLYGDYNYKTFLMISCFQRNISSRITPDIHSGTGLTKVLNEVSELIGYENTYAYVLSGEDIVLFTEGLITEKKTDGINQIGFNKSGKYMNDVPDSISINWSDFYYNGTIFYNRLFIKE